MRILIIIAVMMCVFASPVYSASETSFDEFIKSREVVTTLYFQSSSEGLSKSERNRLSGSIDKLRELQESGRMIRVEGFSSPEGDQEKNFRLSFFRARFVAELIEDKGLPAEVTLTGYGDLRATSGDPTKERRVEIASYLKPVGMKRVKVADKVKKMPPRLELGAVKVAPKDQDIDSYRVDQAIRRKMDDKNKGIADKNEELDQKTSPGLSQTKKTLMDELDRGYTQWRKSVDPDFLPKVSQTKQEADSELKRGYSQWQKAVDSDSPGVTKVFPTQAPIIDALTIEQAIMEKIGAEPPAPTGAVSQVSVDY